MGPNHVVELIQRGVTQGLVTTIQERKEKGDEVKCVRRGDPQSAICTLENHTRLDVAK